MSGVPNSELLLSPLTTQEAILSSRIEGTQTNLGEVLTFEAGQRPQAIDKQTDLQEILNYRRALFDAEKHLVNRPFTLNLLRELHRTLLDSVRGKHNRSGEFRTTQNWIGRGETPIGKAEFVPPSPLILRDYLDNWERYYHGIQPDPLVQLSVIHAQFEILHPFLDGNGRIGRILIPLYLYERKLLSRPTFYMSEWLEERRDEYVGSLRELGRRENSWNRWIEFFMAGIEEQARRNARKAKAIMDLYQRLKAQLIELTHSRFAVPMLDHLFKRPVFQSSDFTFRPAPTRAGLAVLIKAAHGAGIIKLVRPGSGRRGAIYALRELINICEGSRII